MAETNVDLNATTQAQWVPSSPPAHERLNALSDQGFVNAYTENWHDKYTFDWSAIPSDHNVTGLRGYLRRKIGIWNGATDYGFRFRIRGPGGIYVQFFDLWSTGVGAENYDFDETGFSLDSTERAGTWAELISEGSGWAPTQAILQMSQLDVIATHASPDVPDTLVHTGRSPIIDPRSAAPIVDPAARSPIIAPFSTCPIVDPSGRSPTKED